MSPARPAAAPAKSRTRQQAARRRRLPRLSRLLAWLLSAWLGHSGLVLAQVAPTTLPSGAQVVVGRGVLQQAPGLLVIQQGTARLGLDWQSFNIGSGATVEFRQPDAGSVALNRVLGNSGSEIYGQLRANGQVFLTNPNGVLFAPGAKVDVGGLVASTLDLSQQDFAEGRYHFSGGGSGSVLNQGSLAARAGGYLALFGQQVVNQGDISVPGGTVLLASGSAATVSISGSGLLSAVVAPNTLAGRVDNAGRISADGGMVTLTAKSAQDIAASLVNNSGIVRANTLVERAGEIWITGDRVTHSGQIQAAAPNGGDGGRVMLIGDMQSGTAQISGSIDASAASGKGGFVETSAAKVSIADGARVSTRAPGGNAGTWLIDPTNFAIVAGAGAATTSSIGADTLSTNLGSGNVTIATAAAANGADLGDISVNAPVSWSANRLTLNAHSNINVNAALTGTGTASLALEYGQGAVAAGNTSVYTIGAPVDLPSGPSFSTKLGSNGTPVSYTVIGDLAALQALDGNATVLAGNYALGANIDASSTASANGGLGFNPIGDETVFSFTGAAGQAFTGRFDGLGHSISGLVIARPSSNQTGLFAIANNARIANLQLTGGSISGSYMVGGIVGQAAGSTALSNVRSSSTVSGVDDSSNGTAAGGLVGYIAPGTTVSITNSQASGNISGDAGAGNYVGGAVGEQHSGSLANVTASGTVTATLRAGGNGTFFYSGGLVGYFTGSGISNSSASGAVTGFLYAGGLVGYYNSAGNLANSQASGNVSGSSWVGGLVGLAAGSGTLTGSTATGNVTGTGSSSVGGLVGDFSMTGGIVNSTAGAAAAGATPASTVSGGSNTGGLVGYYNSAAALTVNSTQTLAFYGSSVSGGTYVGGLIGYMNSGSLSGTSDTFRISVATDVTATQHAGGLVGRSTGTMSYASYTGTVIGGNSADVGGLIGLATGSVSFGLTNGTVSSGNSGSLGGLIGRTTGTGTLTDSVANMRVIGPSNSTSVGGLVGNYAQSGVQNRNVVNGLVSGGTNTGGLIGYYDSTAPITDGSYTAASISGGGFVGGLIGNMNQAASITGASPSNPISSSANVTSSSVGGGLVGFSQGPITNARATGNVFASSDGGGLVGRANGTGALTNSAATGNVTAIGTNNNALGGLVGSFSLSGGQSGNSASGTVSGATYGGGLIGWYNSATAVADATYTGSSVSATTWAGGLIGYMNSTAAINGPAANNPLLASASVTTTAAGGAAGGLVGRSNGAVTNARATGAVTAAGDAGGLIGQAAGAGGVTGVSAAGAVTGTGTGGNIGGLVGTYTNTGNLSGTVGTATSTGAVQGGSGSGAITGGLVGRFNSGASLVDVSTATTSTVAGGGDTGGLVGDATGTGTAAISGTVVARGNVTGASNVGWVGGLVGDFSMAGGWASTVTVEGAVSGGSGTGGLAGNYGSAAAITGGTIVPASVSGGAWVGGVVGYMSSTAAITGPSAGTPWIVATNVTASGAGGAAGGLVGRSNGAVANVLATGFVSGPTHVGGLVGLAQGAGGFTAVRATGEVTATGSSAAAGGLVGTYTNSGSLVGDVELATASGVVRGGSGSGALTGGLVGNYSSAGSIVGASTATTSAVSGGGDTGGLAGQAAGSGSAALTSSTARGAVTGASGVGRVGGLVGDFSMPGGMSGVAAQGVVSGGDYTGGLVGVYGSAATITGGSYTGASVQGGSWVGGLFGSVSSAAITGPSASNRITVAANVTATGNAGGLAGYTGGSVSNVSASGSVTSTGTGSFYVGGLIGQANAAGGVTDASATGSVTASTQGGRVGGLIGFGDAGSVVRGTATGHVSGGLYTGGLVGRFEAGAASIQNSSASGNVDGFGDAGGLVGYASGTGSVSGSSASGTVNSSATSTYSVGGVAGYFALSGGITTTTTAGNVTGGAQTGGYIGYYNTTTALSGATTPSSVTTVQGSTWVGGVVGYVNQAADLSGLTSSAAVSASSGSGGAGGVAGRTNGSVSGSSASGTVSGPYAVGGLIGMADGTGTLSNGSASGSVNSGTANAWIGGLVGRFSLSGGMSGTISATGNVTGGSSAGGIVGYYNSSAPVSGLTRGAGSVTGQDWVGGLIGYSEATSIESSTSAANVTATGASYAAGGLAGRTAGAISGSSATGSVTAGGDAGGLVGRADGSGAFTDITARGNVSSSSTSAMVGGLIARSISHDITRGNAHGNVSGGSNTGGLVGYYQSGSIVDSHAFGSVVGGTYAGGLVGYFYSAGSITDSSAVGAVTSTQYGGGLVGSFYSSGSVLTSTASGNVSGADRAGGLIGSFEYSGGVTDSRATGAVSGATYAGGLIGYSYSSSGALNNVSAAGSVSGNYMVGGLVGALQSVSISRGTATGRTVAVSDSTVYVGGLVGYATGSGTTYTVADSSASGGVVVDAVGAYVGGLVGLTSSVALANVNASGAVDVRNSRTGSNSSQFVGGLAGYVDANNSSGIGTGRATGAVSGGYYTGGLVGLYTGYTSAANLRDSSASGNVTSSYAGGGLVGYLSGVGVSTSQATGNVTVSNTSGRSGGLVGEVYLSYTGTSINDNTATGHVSGGDYAGGLIGYYRNQLSSGGPVGVTNNRASGNVSNAAVAGGLVGGFSGIYYGVPGVDLGIRNGQASGSVSASRIAGGLVGEFDGYGGLRDSAATGAVTGTSGTSTHQLGGLVGRFRNVNPTVADGALTRSYATGAVALASGVSLNTSTQVNAGGLVGLLEGTSTAALTLTDSYATGAVTLDSSRGVLSAGGLVGRANTSLDNVYATGAVSATGGNSRAAGGLVAARSNTSVVATDSYWATDSSGQASSLIGSGRTLAQLQTAANFNGWSIADSAGSTAVWRIYEGHTTPLLRGFLTPLALTLADVSKTYDGTASLGGATVSFSGGTVQFPERIRVGGTGSGSDVGTYALSAANLYSVHNGYDLNLAGNAQLSITSKTLTLAGLAASRAYDATTAATVTPGGAPGGLVAGEDLLFQPAGDFSMAFADKNVGTAKTVTLSGSYTWADGTRGKVANYTLPTGSSTTADITKATLNAGTFTATNRVYDGTTTVAVTATPASLSGVRGSDDVSVDLSSVSSGTVADRHVGTGKLVTVTGATLSGADAGNYALAGLGSGTVDITPRTLTVNGISAYDRAYNRATQVSLNMGSLSLSGVLGGDLVSPMTSYTSATVASKNVGDGKAVTVTGLQLRGLDAGNYTPQQGPVSVNITPFQLYIYANPTTGSNRTYDGTANAAALLYNNLTYSYTNMFAGDNVTLSNTGISFDNKHVAYNSGGAVTSKTITVSGLSLSGGDAANYQLMTTTTTTTGTITPRALPVSGISAVNRVYDGTRDVQVSVSGAAVDTSVVVSGDNVSVVIPSSGSVTGQMADKNAGNAKAVTVPGLTITGTDAGNYTLNSASNGVTVNIARKTLNPAYTASSRVYDGGTAVQTNATSADILSGDEVLFYSNYYTQYYYYYYGGNPWASFADKNAGTGKTVRATYDELYGRDAANYSLVTPNGTIATADITAKPVTLAFTGVRKVYDGTTTATVTLDRSNSGVVGSDVVSTAQTAEYTGSNAKAVGTAKPISVTGITFSGTDAGNYTVANTTATASGEVTAKPITLSGISGVNRAYDGTTLVQVNASGVTSTGFISGDNVAVSQPSGGLNSGTIANKNVGTAKPVTVTGLSLSGSDAGNYSVDLTGSGITVDIGQKPLTPTYTGFERVYNGGVTASVTSTTTGIESGDTVTFSQQAVFSGGGARNVGTAKPISITSIAIGGSGAGNYSLTSTTASATADITAKPVTVDYTGVNRVYNGLADTSVSVTGTSLQVLAGDFVGYSQTASLTGNGAAGTNRPVAVSNIALTGQDAGNYALRNTTASTTVTITQRPLGVTGITANGRVYDGTTTVAVNVSGATVDTSAKVAGDDVSVTLPPSGISTGTMSDRHVGVAKPVAITGLGISGNEAANYSLVGATGLAVTITPAPLTASYVAADKVYDGNTSARVSASSGDIFGVDASGVSINASGTFTGSGAKNVGAGKAVAVRDGFLEGAQRDNYMLLNPTGSTTASITARSVTASYASGLSRTYDGGVTAPANGSVVNAISGDIVALTQTAEFTGAGARNVGNAKAIALTGIALTGADASNYTLSNSSASTVGNITPKEITVAGLSNVTAVDRVYDGTRTVSVNVPSGITLVPTSSEIISGDNVTIEVPGSGVTTGSMQDKHVGSRKAVTVDGLSLSGTDGGNYRIAGTAGITVNITPRSLSASYLGVNRAYDGTTNASVTGSSADILGSDSVLISGSGVFTGAGAKNVGTGKAISVQQAQLSGADGANYSLSNPTGTATASITQRGVTASYTSPGKTYDGFTDAPVSGSAGFIAGDQVALSQSAVFTGSNARNAGTGKPIEVSGITLSGADADNYALSATTASTQGTIRPKPIGIVGLTGVTARDRVYDGSTAVTVDVQATGSISVNSADIVSGDSVSVTVPSAGATTGVVDNKTVGNAKAVRVTGLALSGTDAPNYTISAAEGVTVNITPRPISASYTGVTRVYDGTTAASVVGSSGDILGSDVVAIAGSGVFTGAGARNVGSAKPISVTSASLSGGDAINYLLTNPSGSAAGEITPLGLTASYTGGSRVYDGSVAAPVFGTLSGTLAGDTVSLTQTAVFTGADARNAGVGKAVAISAVDLAGSDAANYRVTSASTSTTATITPKPLGVNGLSGVTAQNRAYDGTRAVTVTVGSSGSVSANPADIVSGDEVLVTAPASGTGTGLVDDKNVGTAKPVVVSGLGLGGRDAGNYSVGTALGVTVDITPRPITASYSGGSRVYDGSVTASVTGTSADLIGGDAVSITGSGIFTGAGARNVGADKPIAVQSASLGSADAGNYLLLNPTGSATGSITPKPLTATYTGTSRVYDGSTAAQVSAVGNGLVSGDAVSFTQTAAFSGAGARNVGNDKPIAVSGITVNGNDAANYSLTATTASATASITPRPLNISGLSGLQAVDRVYDGTRDVQIAGTLNVNSASGNVVAGDDVIVNLPSGSVNAGSMADKAAGTAKAVALAGLSLGGADAANYQITGTTGLTVNIAPRPVNLLGISAQDRTYDGTSLVSINTAASSLSGILPGDDLQLLRSGVTGTTADKRAGSARPVTLSGLGLGGADAGNYAMVGGDLRVNIAPRVLTVTASAADKVYDGNATAVLSLADDRLAGDVFSLAIGPASFATSNAGTALRVSASGLSLGGTDAANYAPASTALTATATIRPRPLTITANSLSKVYGETVSLPGSAFASSGLVQGESIGAVTLASAGTAATAAVAGSPYAVTASNPSGGSFNPANYQIGFVSGALTVQPRPLTIAANSVLRYADAPNPAVFGFSTSVGSLVGSDSVASVLITAPASSAQAPGGSIFELVPSGAVFGSGTLASNYALSYGKGLLVVLPKPPRIDDVDSGSGSDTTGFVVQVEQAEVDSAQAALARSASLLAQPGSPPPAPGQPTTLREATEAIIGALLSGDASRISLPDLQRMPLISFDPGLRRLLTGGGPPRNPPRTPPTP